MSERRDHLVDTAVRLFTKNGFTATGIDTILAEAGVAKMTLYKHFKTKDDLIVAAIERAERRWFDWFVGRVAELSPEPGGRLLAAFDAFDEWAAGRSPMGSFHGCPLINSAAEFGDPSHRVNETARSLKVALREQFKRWAAETGRPDAVELGEEVALLFEGAIVTAHVVRDPGAARTAKRAAGRLLGGASA